MQHADTFSRKKRVTVPDRVFKTLKTVLGQNDGVARCWAQSSAAASHSWPRTSSGLPFLLRSPPRCIAALDWAMLRRAAPLTVWYTCPSFNPKIPVPTNVGVGGRGGGKREGDALCCTTVHGGRHLGSTRIDQVVGLSRWHSSMILQDLSISQFQ